MEDDKNFEKIMDYSEGAMSESKRREFEEELAKNKELKEEYNSFQSASEVVDIMQYQHLRKQISSFEKKPKKLFISRKVNFSIAASFLLFSLIGLLWYSNANYSNHNISKQYYEAPNLSDLRNGNPQETTELNQVTTAYNNGNFEYVIQTVAAKNDLSTNKLFILGHAYFNTNQSQLALNTFEKINKTKDPRYRESVDWHLVLCHLNLGNNEAYNAKIKEILDNENHGFRQAAIELKRILNSPLRGFVF